MIQSEINQKSGMLFISEVDYDFVVLTVVSNIIFLNHLLRKQ